MSAMLMSILAATMLFTAFLSGIFGMAGGLILMGVLLAVLPLSEAMSLHAITQITSNGWRGLIWIKNVRIKPAINFLLGSSIAFAAWSFWHYIPSKPIALIALGLAPFIVHFIPDRLKPNPENLLHGICYGASSMTLMLLAGVSGPLIDTFFLGGKLDRREIVATKAVCQVASHAAKLVYFGGLVNQTVMLDPTMISIAIVVTIAGTSLARPILEAMSDTAYRHWAGRIIMVIGFVFLFRGIYLLFV
ncbi:MAG: TSUP family transporter [Pseudomonadota bacterium]